MACPAHLGSRRPGGKRTLRPPAHLLMSSSADVAPAISCDGWGPNRRCSTWCGMHKWMGFCYMCARPKCLLVGLACTGPCWSQVCGLRQLLRALHERLPRPPLSQRHVLDPFGKFNLLNLLCQLDILNLLVGSNILDLLVWRIHDARLLGRNLPNLLVAFGCNASADYSTPHEPSHGQARVHVRARAVGDSEGCCALADFSQHRSGIFTFSSRLRECAPYPR